ncbi:MAG: FAD binding domain-containing protein [Anaerolineae bacterium]
MRNLIEICQPATIDETLTLLSRSSPRTAILAGGTELVGQGDPSIEAVVDLSRLGLDTIRLDADALRVGATATLESIAVADQTRAFAGGVLARAAHAATSGLLRRQATIGGSIVTAQAGELLAVLLALGAEAIVYAPQPSTWALADLTHQSLPGPWLLTEIIVPRRPRLGVSVHCVRRTPGDSPLVAVAAALIVSGGLAEYVGTGLAGVGLTPSTLGAAETTLAGQVLSNRLVDTAVEAAVIEAPELTDHRASAEYRAQMIGVLLRRALAESWRAALDPS